MRRTNWRAIVTGFFLIAISIGFYVFMLSVAPSSNDPVAMMKTVGTVSGVLIGVSVFLVVIGLAGKKTAAK